MAESGAAPVPGERRGTEGLERVANARLPPAPLQSPVLNLLSRLASGRRQVDVWLVDRPSQLLTGVLVGCDSFFNLALERAQFSGLWSRADQELASHLTVVRGDNVLLVTPTAQPSQGGR